MSEQTPSQAEGDRNEEDGEGGKVGEGGTDGQRETAGGRQVPRTTPSQAEGDDDEAEQTAEGNDEQGNA
ncbi:hypothetical protein ACGFW5_26525 [Streptomyces sp. NPDC048416]|uniref:hypothetical protein n=1 Tax=Streptomyces sp. NPDC048416 TaxID=3365546 RepID=UPI00372183C9